MITDLNQATYILKSGGVVVMPTDTIYGIVACAKNKLVVKKVYPDFATSLHKELI